VRLNRQRAVEHVGDVMPSLRCHGERRLRGACPRSVFASQARVAC
jgi:hypothetical protein